MSFVSGIMMGASIGKGIHDILVQGGTRSRRYQPAAGAALPHRRGTVVDDDGSAFALLSRLPGRRRYRLAVLVSNATLAAALEKQLLAVEAVEAVQANPVTGSLLLLYARTEAGEAAVNQAMEELRCCCSQYAQMMDTVCRSGGGSRSHVPTLYSRSWSGVSSLLNRRVRQLTGNSFDIYALVSLFFLLRGIRKMLVYGQRPSGPSMIWWAMHLMKGWRG